MNELASTPYMTALLGWLELLRAQGHAHGVLLVQAMYDQGLSLETIRGVDAALSTMERDGWVVRGDRRPLPVYIPLGVWSATAAWTFEWLLPWSPASKGFQDMLDFLSSLRSFDLNFKPSPEFESLASLADFDRAARNVQRKVLAGRDFSDELAAMTTQANRYVATLRPRPQTGDGGGKDGGK